MEFLLVLLIPLGFIGVFLAAPFWISRATKAEHEEVLTGAQDYEGQQRDEFIEAQRTAKRLGEYGKSLSGGVVLILIAGFALLTGELSFRGGDPIVSQADGDDRFFAFVGIILVLGVWLSGYGLIGKWKNRTFDKSRKRNV
ncbi:MULTISPECIES: hypothetical protein [Marinobacter]|uniref:hypothetical protein n=1 Tax=Marinobacter TaxID=2742 RepID=UPI00241FDAE1|nr:MULTISPECIES: hypothetical protein [Marinobacter]MCW9011879.1 hypothetical protein [Marinobacter sp.]